VEASSVNGEAQPERGPRPVNKRLVLLVGVALVLIAVGIAAWRPLLRSYRLSQGRLALESRDARLALQYFHAARQLAPEHAETHFQIARAHRQLGQLDRVHESLKTAWRLGYDIASLEREQWLVLAQAGELKDAEPQLIALLSDPKETRPRDLRGIGPRLFHPSAFRGRSADAGRVASRLPQAMRNRIFCAATFTKRCTATRMRWPNTSGA
jgi:tetratricopeptide (TPR) repeat protein